MRFVAQVEEFAAQRRGLVDNSAEALRPVLVERLALFNDGEEDWVQGVINACSVIWDVVVEDEGSDPVDFAPFRVLLEESLARTTLTTEAERPAQVERMALWLAALTVNAATLAAAQAERGEFILGEWVTMADDDVRDLHRPLNGVQRPIGETFDVGGFDLQYPAQPVGPPEVWINCRCVLRPVLGDEMAARTTFTLDEKDISDDDILADAPMMDTEDEFDFPEVPIHGVLAPLNKVSGDRRMFVGGIATAGPDLPLRWVKYDTGEHQGAVRVAVISNTWEENDEIRFDGRVLSTAESDEVINLLAQGPMGVSVDLDTAEFELRNDDGTPWADSEDAEGIEGAQPIFAVTSGRIRAATLVDIPAFVEAWVALGTWDDEMMEEEVEGQSAVTASGCAPCAARELDAYYGTLLDFAISEAEWDGSASRFTDEEWIRSCVVDRGESFGTPKERYAVPIREPNGDINRAAVHNAAARINQVDASPEAISAGKRKLVAAYRALDEDPPEVLVASAFATGTHDGPGWVTHPRATARIRRYWTHGAGAAKIGWGSPGSFRRCRAQLGKYIKNAKWLSGTCANMYKEATGRWPGRQSGRFAVSHDENAIMASAFTVLSDVLETYDASWFENPNLERPTLLTITEDGRVFGHIAAWKTCHIGFGLPVGDGNGCTAPPFSATNYANYMLHPLRTTEGDISVGTLTIGTGHAGGNLRPVPASAHYDNTGHVAAYVKVGEDAHGIWFAGALNKDLPPKLVRAFYSANLSGDWRFIDGNYELVAALAVNVPGFPIQPVTIAASGGHQVALIAAGVVHETVAEPFSLESVADQVEQILAQRAQRKERLAAARALVRTQRLAVARASVSRYQ